MSCAASQSHRSMLTNWQRCEHRAPGVFGSVRTELARDGLSFIPKVVVGPDFLTGGVAYGHDEDSWWAVIDPAKHPLCVWKKCVPGPAAYGRSARILDAAIFTNGPMMGKRLGRTRKVTRGSAAWEFAIWTGMGIICGLASGWRLGSPYLGGVGGAIIGVGLAWLRIFTNWVPCGAVISAYSGIDDQRPFDGERHAWLGRSGHDFSSYRVGLGDPPKGVCEGLGGLILLVRNFRPAGTKIGDVAFNDDFAQLSKKNGVVAWGLVPLDRAAHSADERGPEINRTEAPAGVIVVIGSRGLNAEVVAARLCAIGTRDAVAMDQRACIMMGAAGQFMIGPPPLHRQDMQRYGLYCQ